MFKKLGCILICLFLFSPAWGVQCGDVSPNKIKLGADYQNISDNKQLNKQAAKKNRKFFSRFKGSLRARSRFPKNSNQI